MSRRFEKLKRYYERGIWTAKMLLDAVAREWITAEEYEVILHPDATS